MLDTFNFKKTALFLGLFACLTASQIFAEDVNLDCGHDRCGGSRAIQANFQDTSTIAPVVDTPIPFTVRNFKDNFRVNAERTIFEVKIPGLYSLDAFLLLNVPTVGGTVEGYITINGRKMLTFFESETRTDALSPIVPFHFEDRLVYLEKGDLISVILSSFPEGTTVLSRGLVFIAL